MMQIETRARFSEGLREAIEQAIFRRLPELDAAIDAHADEWAKRFPARGEFGFDLEERQAFGVIRACSRLATQLAGDVLGFLERHPQPR